MPNTPSDDERQTEQAFNALLGKLVNTPHKPHKSKSEDEPSKPPGAGASS